LQNQWIEIFVLLALIVVASHAEELRLRSRSTATQCRNISAMRHGKSLPIMKTKEADCERI
jgi:hypothetical protein